MPSRATRFYLRIVYVLIGAALALALVLLDVTLIAMLVQTTDLPIWAVAVLGAFLVVVPIVALGLVPAMRTVQGVAVQTLLGVDMPGGPPGPAHSWTQHRRTLAWFTLHLLSGAVVVAAVMATVGFASGWWVLPLLVGALASAAGLGELLARAAPSMLGPTDAERIAILERDVERAVERNRLAREIHDGVGHALSLVTVQAGAARKVIDHDPEFAVAALAAIETAARGAAADLDHVLGLLREDGARSEAAPAPDLGSLEQLVGATRAAGLDVTVGVTGDLATVPPLVSREAYRIVQEALTNALKYSADGTARLDVERHEGSLGIVASNPQAAGSTSRTGRGLRGTAERVQALGGSFSSEPDAGGAWTLSAVLPLPVAS